MSELKAVEYKRFEEIKHIREDGSEYWSARELGPALDYVKWENFSKVIKRAMVACENSGHSVYNDFPEVRKIVDAGATKKPVKDYELSIIYWIIQWFMMATILCGKGIEPSLNTINRNCLYILNKRRISNGQSLINR